MTAAIAQPPPLPRKPRAPYLVAGLVIFMAAAVTTQLADRIAADPSRPVLFRPAPQEPAATPGDDILVATFNIHSGKGRDNVADLGRTAKVIERFDLVALQEVRGGWFGQPDQADVLGQTLSLGSIFLPTERQFANDHFGQGILSRLPLKQSHRIPLLGTRGKAYRSLVWSQFEWRNQTMNLLTAHIDSREDREDQLKVAISLFQALSPPVLLMGDLNSSPADPQLKSLLEAPDVRDLVADGISSKSVSLNDLAVRIDWILGRGFTATESWIIDGPASDHPLVGARLRLTQFENN